MRKENILLIIGFGAVLLMAIIIGSCELGRLTVKEDLYRYRGSMEYKGGHIMYVPNK